MFILNIIPAPVPKKAVLYNPENDTLIIQPADIIALMELENPDAPGETATIPMYLCSDSLGVYFPPQMDITFLDLIDSPKTVDIGDYTDQILEIKKFFDEAEADTVEVETKGNVSQIKRFVRPRKKEEPKNDS